MIFMGSFFLLGASFMIGFGNRVMGNYEFRVYYGASEFSMRWRGINHQG